MVTDFSGMVPLRNELLLPDNAAQYSENTWLYRGGVRGFRHALVSHTCAFNDTTQIYRIPKNSANPPDFTDAGSLWLEFPDPFMTAIRNPTAGDTFNRYYFFPSDQFAPVDHTFWPDYPCYTTLANLEATTPAPPFKLGVPQPTGGAPTVTAPAATVTYNANAATAVGSDVLHFASTANVLAGMSVVDNTKTTATASTTASTAAGSATLTFSSTAGIVAGMTIADQTNPSAILSGNTVASVTSTTVVMNGVALFTVASGDVIVFTSADPFPAGTTVQSITSTTVTLNNAVVAPVYNGDQIQFLSTPETRAYLYTYVSGFGEEGPPSPATVVTGNVNGTWQIIVPQPAAGDNTNRNIQFIRLYRTVTDASGNASYFQVTPADIPVAWTTATPFTLNTSASAAAASTTLTFASTTGATINMEVANTTHSTSLAAGTLVTAVTPTSVTISPAVVSTVSSGDSIKFTTPILISDSALDQNITSNKPLDSVDYTPPPDGLQGVVMMANGIMAGFTNEREVWFSAAYLPHAWPGLFALTVDYPIVGLTANGSSLNIITEGPPSIATGVTPDTMTISKITANEPCIGRGSIAASGEGAYYASPNGLILLNTGGTALVTAQIYEKEFHWALQPWNWAGGKYGGLYIAFIKGVGATPVEAHSLNGVAIDALPGENPSNVSFSYLHYRTNVRNLYSDELSGQLFGLLDNGTVMQWNPPAAVPGTTTLWDWVWKSKKYRFTFPQQFKCFLVLFRVPPEVEFTPGARVVTPDMTYDPTSQWLIVRIFADGRQAVVREVQKSGEVLMSLSGFKATEWEIQFEGIVQIDFYKMATSIKELKSA